VLLVALVVVKGAVADLHQLLAVRPWIELSNMQSLLLLSLEMDAIPPLGHY
jgi:hypothetical protein